MKTVIDLDRIENIEKDVKDIKDEISKPNHLYQCVLRSSTEDTQISWIFSSKEDLPHSENETDNELNDTDKHILGVALNNLKHDKSYSFTDDYIVSLVGGSGSGELGNASIFGLAQSDNKYLYQINFDDKNGNTSSYVKIITDANTNTILSIDNENGYIYFAVIKIF